MVIGAGIAGVQAALDLANSGFYVHLVEKKSAIGGVMAQLDKTFPTNDCSMCIISPKLVECGRHLNIQIHTLSEVKAIAGEPGNFTVTVEQEPRYVDPAKCIACGICTASCPDSALISTVTDRPVDEATRYFKKFKNPPKGIPWDRFALNINADPAACKGCGVCAQVCPTDALKMADKTAVKDEDFLPAACRAWDNTVNLAPFVDKLSLNHQVLFV